MGPSNYGEWCKLFDQIEKSARNDDYIQMVRNGSISWTSGVAERFVKAASNMMRNRINKAQDVFQTQLKNSRGMDPGVSRALQVLAKEYRYLFQIAHSLPIPLDYQGQMAKLVQDQADTTVDSLMESSKTDRTGKLANLVKSAGINKLNRS